jgi:uncharacterized OB-fold protein
MGRPLSSPGPGTTEPVAGSGEASLAASLAASIEGAVEGAVDPLRGSRCGACGTVAFPVATGCQRCGGQQLAELDLSRDGVVWGWTVQRFAPKSPPYVPPPDGFTPFAVGYVQLPDGVTVQALLECADIEQLDVGLAVRLIGTEPVPRFAPQVEHTQKGTV